MREEPRRCCPVWRWTKRIARTVLILTLIATPIAFFAVPKLMRSDCMRQRVEREASKSLGVPVHIGRLDFTWRGGLVAHDVTTDEVPMGDEMVGVYSAKEVQIRPKACKLLSKEPKVAANLREPRLEVRWVGERCCSTAADSPRAPKFARAKAIDLYRFTIENGTVVIDHPSFVEPVKIDSIYATGSLEAKKGHFELDVAELKANLNGGHVAANGRLEIRREGATGRIALDAHSVDVNDFVVQAVRNLQPMIQVQDGGLHKGAMDLKVDATTESPTAGGLLQGLTGKGELRVFGASIQGSRILHVVGQAAGVPQLVSSRIGGITQRFDLERGRVLLRQVRADFDSGTATMTGWMDLGGRIDVTFDLDHRIGQGEVKSVRVIGTVDQPEPMRN